MDYPYRFTKTAKQDTSQMQTPQATHIFTQRLIEIRTETKRQKTHANAEMLKIKHLYKIYIKQI